MKSIQVFLILLLGTTSQTSFGQFTDEINSNRPGKSMMAFAVGKKIFQVETGVNYVSEDHEILGYKSNGFMGELVLRYGVWKEELEIIGELQYQNDKLTSGFFEEKRNGFKQLTLGAKYLIYDPFKNYEEKVNIYSWKANQKFKWRQFIPAFSLYAGANFNVGENPFNYAPATIEEPTVSPKVTAIAQNHFGGRWVFVTNLTYDKIGTDFASLNYIITLIRGFNSKWSGFIENQGYKGDYYSDSVFRLGAAFLFDNHMQVDASIGKNIKDTPGLFNAGIGFSWRFADQYEEVKIMKNNGSKMDKKMNKKAEKEAKKRKDTVE
ncbi:transporter [Flavobacterium cucumis]|uniref:Putative MetA-pathway of phenol degradation n=1 Tax=Flavobacterium cucumis TaxID=416016 RepID=A0A1M7ZXM4_9FLAO|nr:transporter [Flavobacterium cucumis]SHO73583.1 Putative MetA-pathway of phenol degradation [Flavobacterium cucumis]